MGPIYGALASSLGDWDKAPQEVLGRFHAFCEWLTPYLLLGPAMKGGARDGFVREVSLSL